MSDDKAAAAYHPFSSFDEWQEAQEWGVEADRWEKPGKIQGARIGEVYMDEVYADRTDIRGFIYFDPELKLFVREVPVRHARRDRSVGWLLPLVLLTGLGLGTMFGSWF